MCMPPWRSRPRLIFFLNGNHDGSAFDPGHVGASRPAHNSTPNSSAMVRHLRLRSMMNSSPRRSVLCSALVRSRGRLALPLRVDIRARDADPDLLLQLDHQHAVVADAGDLADQPAAGDDLIPLAELAEHGLGLLLLSHLRPQ